ncbi:MAG: radical SAM family heme chaperone HemW [Muribaculaceae bacterium]|nr:radical SAM family heme chaperone HemW [Muribaculaceae bacterium]
MPGLYIHTPFCHSKCAYCDFYSMPIPDGMAMRYAHAVARELEMRADAYPPFSTLYLGGGTPSILPIDALATMMPAVPDGEVTIEVNPEDVTLDKARAWLDLGINRASMGVQSLDDGELAIIGRCHSAAQAIKAYEMLRSAGFANVSLDLIYGLPGQSLESWERSLSTLLALHPEHLSAYMLSFEPRTRLSAMLRAGKVKEADEETLEQMYAVLRRASAEAGFEHYEISNFALPGRRARHNSSYWTGEPYLGLGPGAHSFDGKDRWFNPSNLRGYLDRIESGIPAAEIDPEDDDSRFNDRVMTALRTADGLDLATVPPKRLKRLLRDAAPYQSSGHLILDDNRLRIPPYSWLISDTIISDLFQV